MTRINLLVARVVLLGFCILCISSGSVWAEENKISVTAYTLKECYQNNGKTASGKFVKTGMVAVSRDLERKGFKLGTKIKISNMGTFIVMDRTSHKNRGNVDIYMPSYAKALRFGRQKYALVQNQEEIDFLNGKQKYVCILN